MIVTSEIEVYIEEDRGKRNEKDVIYHPFNFYSSNIRV